jgi:hypothetical protein
MTTKLTVLETGSVSNLQLRLALSKDLIKWVPLSPTPED